MLTAAMKRSSAAGPHTAKNAIMKYGLRKILACLLIEDPLRDVDGDGCVPRKKPCNARLDALHGLKAKISPQMQRAIGRRTLQLRHH